jgi:hypothetical protein
LDARNRSRGNVSEFFRQGRDYQLLPRLHLRHTSRCTCSTGSDPERSSQPSRCTCSPRHRTQLCRYGHAT